MGQTLSQIFDPNTYSDAVVDSDPQLEDFMIKGCYRDPSWSWYIQPLPAELIYGIAGPLLATFILAKYQQHWFSQQTLFILMISSMALGISIIYESFAFKGIFGSIFLAAFGFLSAHYTDSEVGTFKDNAAGATTAFVTTFAGTVILSLNGLGYAMQGYHFGPMIGNEIGFSMDIVTLTLKCEYLMISKLLA